MRSDRERLEDILDAIAAIERHPIADRADFDANELLRFFLLKHVEIIGEAVYKLSPELKQAHPAVEWTKVARCRHVLVHDYFDIDWDILWAIVRQHVPVLRQQIRAISPAA